MCQYLSFGPNSPQRGPVERGELAALFARELLTASRKGRRRSHCRQRNWHLRGQSTGWRVKGF